MACTPELHELTFNHSAECFTEAKPCQPPDRSKLIFASLAEVAQALGHLTGWNF